MIFPNPKKAAVMILSKMDKDGGPDKMQEVKSESEVQPDMEGLKSAAEDIMQAISDKSPHDLMMALKSFCEMADVDAEEE